MLQVKKLRCCGLENPLGLDAERIDFSWQILSDKNDVVQHDYEINVYDGIDNINVWSSGIVESEQQNGITYAGVHLKSNHIYYYQVTVHDNHGECARSDIQSFSVGIQQNEWKAKWIGRCKDDVDETETMATKEEMVKDFMAMVSGQEMSGKKERKLQPCNIYRKVFEVSEGVENAFLSITAHGLYEARINGIKITNSCMNPGFTAYDKYLEFQTYDVKKLLKSGNNVLTVILADGWYKGTFGILGYGNNYGTELSLLAQLELQNKDGQKEFVVTDESFMYSQSKYIYSDLIIGEKQDNRIVMDKFYDPEAKIEDMKYAQEQQCDFNVLHGICCEPVQCTERLTPKEIITTPKGELVIDIGQNMVGGIRFCVSGEAGTQIKLEYSEVLDKDGNFINNISGINRDQTDYVILSGKEGEYFEPTFSVHGFRYVKVSGYQGTLKKEDVEGIVIGSNLESAGNFVCSDPKLNQLQSNIKWSQKGNMLSIPTDCPQRERAGWTGDILVYGKTAVYNQNVKQFLRKWLKNMEKEQFENGLIPIIVPYPIGYNAMQVDAFGSDTSAGWGDAAIVVPWVLYETYGDITILQESFSMMRKWMSYVEKDAAEGIPEFEEPVSEERMQRQKYLWNTNFHFGDWLYPSCKNEKGEADMFRSAYTTKEKVATIMYAQSTNIMKEVCGILGNRQLEEHYERLNTKIREAFRDEYVNEDGSIDGAVQGIYVLALAHGIVEGLQKQKMAQHLVEMIKENGNCLDTGFMSVKYILPVLVENGYTEVAKTLLYQEKCPSWLYEVKNGATTIWETWNCILEDGTRTKESYNHYAFGCIGEWMYKNLAGISVKKPGYKEFMIKPSFDYGLTEVDFSYESIYGQIKNSWKIKNNKGYARVEIPAGTKAHIVYPGIEKELGSGKYEFSFSLTKGEL